jgi:hypothetical protein
MFRTIRYEVLYYFWKCSALQFCFFHQWRFLLQRICELTVAAVLKEMWKKVSLCFLKLSSLLLYTEGYRPRHPFRGRPVTFSISQQYAVTLDRVFLVESREVFMAALHRTNSISTHIIYCHLTHRTHDAKLTNECRSSPSRSSQATSSSAAWPGVPLPVPPQSHFSIEMSSCIPHQITD